jgi:hypothetical protein
VKETSRKWWLTEMNGAFCYGCSRWMDKVAMGVTVQDGYQVRRGDLFKCVCGNSTVTEFGEPYDANPKTKFISDKGAQVQVFVRKVIEL